MCSKSESFAKFSHNPPTSSTFETNCFTSFQFSLKTMFFMLMLSTSLVDSHSVFCFINEGYFSSLLKISHSWHLLCSFPLNPLPHAYIYVWLFMASAFVIIYFISIIFFPLVLAPWPDWFSSFLNHLFILRPQILRFYESKLMNIMFNSRLLPLMNIRNLRSPASSAFFSLSHP